MNNVESMRHLVDKAWEFGAKDIKVGVEELATVVGMAKESAKAYNLGFKDAMDEMQERVEKLVNNTTSKSMAMCFCVVLGQIKEMREDRFNDI